MDATSYYMRMMSSKEKYHQTNQQQTSYTWFVSQKCAKNKKLNAKINIMFHQSHKLSTFLIHFNFCLFFSKKSTGPRFLKDYFVGVQSRLLGKKKKIHLSA